MRHLKTVLTVIGAVTILVLAGNTVALATTGQAFLLGKSNTANVVTTLTRTTAGPALKLTTTSSTVAPMVVNGKGKVVNLQADMVDAYEGSQMLNKVYVYTRAISVIGAKEFTITLNNVPAGKYVFNSSGFIYADMAAGHGCYLTVPSTGQAVYEWFPGNAADFFFMINGSGYVLVPSTQNLTYRCYDNDDTSQTWSSLAESPLQLVFTKMASLTTGSTSVARVPSPRQVPTN